MMDKKKFENKYKSSLYCELNTLQGALVFHKCTVLVFHLQENLFFR